MRRPQNLKKISHLFWQNSCFLLSSVKTSGRFFSNFCGLFRKAGLYVLKSLFDFTRRSLGVFWNLIFFGKFDWFWFIFFWFKDLASSLFLFGCLFWYFFWCLCKGQLISEWLLDVFIWTKKRTKIFLYFCLTSLKYRISLNKVRGH